jgi:hypothetical protein
VEGFGVSDFVTTVKITNPDALNSEEMRELFDRTFADPKFMVSNTKELVEYLQDHLSREDPGIHLWVSCGSYNGLCGMGIITTWTNPLSPFPFLVHLAAEIKEAREPMRKAMHDFLRGEGFTNFGTHNCSHLSDRTIFKIFSKFGPAEAVGSLILWQLED